MIDFSEYPAITYGSVPPDPWQALLGDGVTKTGGDEWNALLITRYLRWVSTQIPTRTVRVIDEGGYVLASFLVFRDGNISVDSNMVKQQCKSYRDNGRSDLIPKLDEAVQKACRGEFFLAVPAKDYADRKEIAALGLAPEDLAKLSLDEVADKLTFPWQTDWLTSPNRF